MQKIAIILGTRPELIKLAPVIRHCEQTGVDYFVIHTGQHYSVELDELIFKDLNLPYPKYLLSVGSGLHGMQTGKMLTEIEKILLDEKPTVTLVQGDTNSVLAGALAAVKLHIPVGHIEAGLRSFDRTMPEEINRIVTDNISDFLFAPTEIARANLLKEGIPEQKIYMVGNTIVDSVMQSVDIAKEKSTVLSDLNLTSKKYFLLTIHRAENTDDQETLKRLVSTLHSLADKYVDLPIVWPMHPRTKSKLEMYGIYEETCQHPRLQIVKPVGFLDFLQLEFNARLAITDSGGVQEETCIMNIPCVTLRENTERPETVDVGANIIVGTSTKEIFAGVDSMLMKTDTWINPFGDGTSSAQIVDVLIRE